MSQRQKTCTASQNAPSDTRLAIGHRRPVEAWRNNIASSAAEVSRAREGGVMKCTP